ncbi:hypothetical protein A2U01_0091749, partial [Trifolium medium]|nr:hypothetical protein [Trifolium medium]
ADAWGPSGAVCSSPSFLSQPVFDEETQMTIPTADEAILVDLGPEAIRGEIANHSMTVFKLLETVTFLNGRECKYLQERDA